MLGHYVVALGLERRRPTRGDPPSMASQSACTGRPFFSCWPSSRAWHPRHAGFGSRLIKTVLDAYGGVRLDLNSTGLACFMVVDLDRPDARIEERPRTSRKCGSKPHSHSMRH